MREEGLSLLLRSSHRCCEEKGLRCNLQDNEEAGGLGEGGGRGGVGGEPVSPNPVQHTTNQSTSKHSEQCTPQVALDMHIERSVEVLAKLLSMSPPWRAGSTVSLSTSCCSLEGDNLPEAMDHQGVVLCESEAAVHEPTCQTESTMLQPTCCCSIRSETWPLWQAKSTVSQSTSCC